MFRGGARWVRSGEIGVAEGALELDRFGESCISVMNQHGLEVSPVPGPFALYSLGPHHHQPFVPLVHGFRRQLVGRDRVHRRLRLRRGGVGGRHCRDPSEGQEKDVEAFPRNYSALLLKGFHDKLVQLIVS